MTRPPNESPPRSRRFGPHELGTNRTLVNGEFGVQFFPSGLPPPAQETAPTGSCPSSFSLPAADPIRMATTARSARCKPALSGLCWCLWKPGEAAERHRSRSRAQAGSSVLADVSIQRHWKESALKNWRRRRRTSASSCARPWRLITGSRVTPKRSTAAPSATRMGGAPARSLRPWGLRATALDLAEDGSAPAVDRGYSPTHG